MLNHDLFQIGQIPSLDLVFMKNPILRLLDKYGLKSVTFPVVTFARARMGERLAEMSGNDGAQAEKSLSNRADLLSQFLKAKDQRPKILQKKEDQKLTLP